MKPGLKALAIVLLFAGLVLVNYLATQLPLRVDATADQIYTLSPGTRALLGKVTEPVTIDFYFSKDASGVPILYKNYAARVQEMLRQYARASDGRVTVNLINPKPDTPEEEKAMSVGLQPHNDPSSGGDPVYLGLVATLADQRASIPVLTPEREQLLEYDLSQLIYKVQQVNKKKLGFITSLPLLGVPFDMMTGRSQPGQIIADEWANTYEIKTVTREMDQLPDNLDALAIIHPQNLSPKLQFAIDQFILSGKPVFLALDPSSQFFKRQGGQMAMFGGPQPGVSSDLPALLPAYGITYNAQNIVGDPAHPTPVQTSRDTVSRVPTWLSLEAENFSAQAQPTAQLKTLMFVEAGSFTFVPAPGLTVTPLVETSAQGGDLSSMMAQMTPPDELTRALISTGQKTVAALLQGKFKTAFPDGAPKDPPADDPAKKDETPAPKSDPATFLKESAAASTLIVVGDTDWLFDDYIFDARFRQAGVLSPRNDNLALASNALDYLAGSSDLISLRGKGASFRPFKVVQQMEATAQKKYQEQLGNLESRINEVQAKLTDLQSKKTEGGRLVATPEMQKAIEDFQKQEAAMRGERREIRRTLREDIDSLGRRLMWLNLLATPVAVGLFGIFFQRIRKK